MAQTILCNPVCARLGRSSEETREQQAFHFANQDPQSSISKSSSVLSAISVPSVAKSFLPPHEFLGCVFAAAEPFA